VENVFDFILLIANLVVVSYYMSVSGDRTPASWFCMKYQDKAQCMAADRNLSELLLPWPCQWNTIYEVPCSKPTCSYEINGEGIALEYFALAYALLFLASYMSSFEGGMTKPSERESVAECCCPGSTD